MQHSTSDVDLKPHPKGALVYDRPVRKTNRSLILLMVLLAIAMVMLFVYFFFYRGHA
jgi:hypothetical protein